MNIVFITDLRKMTYEHYLKKPNPMIEWRLNAILAKNPEILKKNEGTSLIHQLENVVIFLTIENFKILYKSFQVISSK